jgi:hypothetical protein
MNKKYTPIKNETYPLIITLILTFIGSIFIFTQISNSIWYLTIGIPLMILTIVLAYYVYGALYSHIELNDYRIEYVYNNKRVWVRWDDVLEVKNVYPDKKIFAKRRDLYEIKIIRIITTGSNDIIFHYLVGPPIKSIKNIHVPYTIDPNLSKGMWLSNKDAMSLIASLKNILPSQVVKVN